MWRNNLRQFQKIARIQYSTGIESAEPTFSQDELGKSSEQMPFARARIGAFFQTPPTLRNPYVEDKALQNFLKRLLPDKVLRKVTPDLERFGDRLVSEVHPLHDQLNQEPPRLEQYDAWGRRVDNLITSPAWKRQKDISAEEGLVAIAYERKHQQYSRLHQAAKLYMYAPSSGLYACPLAMTDGAARTLEVVGDETFLVNTFPKLTSRDPAKFWTSGQWMTERKGGSDVAAGTETLAKAQGDGTYKLYGYKWFTSATDSEMALTLARVVDEYGQTTEGTRGLSLFYLETRNPDGLPNKLQVERLKNKLGTRQLPTAELLLDGTVAHKISHDGRGVAGISSMLSITRYHNAVASLGTMRRMLNLARDYSMKRQAFKKSIHDHSLHMQTLARMEVEARGALALLLEVARLMGLEETNQASDEDQMLLRFLLPVMKLYTAKQAMKVASEGLESFGGQGYIEDTGLPSILRDAQVQSIWEGTTNVLSLDVLRAISRSGGKVMHTFTTEVTDRVDPHCPRLELAKATRRVCKGAENIAEFTGKHTHLLETAARDFAYSIARTYIGMLLIEQANWEGATHQDIVTAKRWCEQDVTPLIRQLRDTNYSRQGIKDDYSLVMDGYTGYTNKP